MILVACRAGPEPEPTFVPPVRYDERIAAIEEGRLTLAARHAPRDEVRTWLSDRIVSGLVPAWLGTPWDFHGTADRPGAGEIACGHFVGTVLRDAGFRVDRLAVGRLPSEQIIGLFAEPSERLRFRDRSPSDIVGELLGAPDGLYGVGLDHHAGLMWKQGDHLRFCHASWAADAVVCEDPVTSACIRQPHTSGARSRGSAHQPPGTAIGLPASQASTAASVRIGPSTV